MSKSKKYSKETLTEVVGWVVKGLFNRSVKTAEKIVKHDPRFRQMVKDAAQAVADSEDRMDTYLMKRYGGTAEEIEKKAKKMGVSVDKYIETFLRGKKHLIKK